MLAALLLTLALSTAPADDDSVSLQLKCGLTVLTEFSEGLKMTHPLVDRPVTVSHGLYDMEKSADSVFASEICALGEGDTLRVFSTNSHVALMMPPALDITSPIDSVVPSTTFLFEGSDPTVAPIFLIVRTGASDIIVTWMPPITTDSTLVSEPREVSSVVYTSRPHDRYAPVSYNGSSPTHYLGSVTPVSCGGVPNTSTDLIIDGKQGVTAYEGGGLVGVSIEESAAPDQPSALYAVNCKSGMPIYIPLKR